MTKFFVTGEQADGSVVPVAAGVNGDEAPPAFENAVASGKYVGVELFRYPKASKRWTKAHEEAVEARSAGKGKKSAAAAAAAE